MTYVDEKYRLVLPKTTPTGYGICYDPENTSLLRIYVGCCDYTIWIPAYPPAQCTHCRTKFAVTKTVEKLKFSTSISITNPDNIRRWTEAWTGLTGVGVSIGYVSN